MADYPMGDPRTAFGEALAELGLRDRRIIGLNADLSGSTKTSLLETATGGNECRSAEYPRQFFNMGISEQNMMGAAAGLAASGKIVFPSTFAIFAAGRVFDQIRQSIAYPKLNVKIVATHSGVSVGGDGASHQMLEDISIMTALPNMRVLAPVDAVEMREMVRTVAYIDGPFYLRTGRTRYPTLLPDDYEFRLGRAPVLRDGDDVTIMGIGLMAEKSLLAASRLEEDGISARVVNMSSIKPLDLECIHRACRDTAGIVSVEEHNRVGGLGSRIASEVVRDRPVPMRFVAVDDSFGRSGDVEGLFHRFGLTTDNIVDMAKQVIRDRL